MSLGTTSRFLKETSKSMHSAKRTKPLSSRTRTRYNSFYL